MASETDHPRWPRHRRIDVQHTAVVVPRNAEGRGQQLEQAAGRKIELAVDGALHLRRHHHPSSLRRRQTPE